MEYLKVIILFTAVVLVSPFPQQYPIGVLKGNEDIGLVGSYSYSYVSGRVHTHESLAARRKALAAKLAARLAAQEAEDNSAFESQIRVQYIAARDGFPPMIKVRFLD